MLRRAALLSARRCVPLRQRSVGMGGLSTAGTSASALSSFDSLLFNRQLVRSQHTTGASGAGAGLPKPSFFSASQLQQSFAELRERCANLKPGKVYRLDGPDPVAASHVCGAEPRTLRETPIKELPFRKPAKGMCTTVTVFAPAVVGYSLELAVRDAAGTADYLSVRNWQPMTGRLTPAEADALLPVGTVIRLLEPYLKQQFHSGGTILRVDNPANMQILSRPGFSLAPGASPERALELAQSLQARGDEHLAAGRAAAALDCFTAGLNLGDELPAPVRASLCCSRAAAALHLGRFAAALLDCDRALALDPSRADAALHRCEALVGTGRSAAAVALASEQLTSLGTSTGSGSGLDSDRIHVASTAKAAWEAALQKAREAEAMRSGKFDIMTMPLTLKGRASRGVGTYIGPVAVRDTGTSRGWGLFLTRDVKEHELLLMEQPLYARVFTPGDVELMKVEGEDGTDSELTPGLAYLVQTPGADADGQIAAKLATLRSEHGPRWALEPPSEAALRGEAFLPVPPTTALSARHIRGIKFANCFGLTISAADTEPTAWQRQPLAWEVDPAARAASKAVSDFVAEFQSRRVYLPSTPLQGAAMAELLQANMDEAGRAQFLESLDNVGPSSPAGPAGPAGTVTASGTTDHDDSEAGKSGGQSSHQAGAGGDSGAAGSVLQRLIARMPPEQLKAELDRQDPAGGMTALHFAVEFGALEDVQALLAAGANPNIFDKRGVTPLHTVAGDRCDEGMLHALLDAGADINAMTPMPGVKTPLQFALVSEHADSAKMLRALLARGADPLIMTFQGFSTLDVLYSLSTSNTVAEERGAIAEVAADLPGKLAALAAAGYDRARFERETREGSALYWVASFMNHETSLHPNTWRLNFGGTMILIANRDLPAGAELTTVYVTSERALRHRGIAPPPSSS